MIYVMVEYGKFVMGVKVNVIVDLKFNDSFNMWLGLLFYEKVIFLDIFIYIKWFY